MGGFGVVTTRVRVSVPGGVARAWVWAKIKLWGRGGGMVAMTACRGVFIFTGCMRDGVGRGVGIGGGPVVVGAGWVRLGLASIAAVIESSASGIGSLVTVWGVGARSGLGVGVVEAEETRRVSVELVLDVPDDTDDARVTASMVRGWCAM